MYHIISQADKPNKSNVPIYVSLKEQTCYTLFMERTPSLYYLAELKKG